MKALSSVTPAREAPVGNESDGSTESTEFASEEGPSTFEHDRAMSGLTDETDSFSSEDGPAWIAKARSIACL